MRKHERGIFNVVAATTLVVAVLIVALALDTGRFYLEQRRLQGAADAAALAAARELNQHADAGEMLAAVEQGALASAKRNGYAGDLSAADALAVGHMEESATTRLFAAGYDPTDGRYTAVRVTLRDAVPRSIVAPGLLPGTVPLAATAVAKQEAIGQIQVGSFLVKAELLKPILGRLLGADVTLFSYDQLLGAQLRLGDLKAAVGADTMDELLNTSLSLGQFLRVSADALRRGGNELAALQLDQFARMAMAPLPVRIGDLLNVSSDNAAVLDGRLNAFGLLMASAQVANRDRQISNINLDVAALGLSGIGALKLDLKVREAPQTAVGPPGINPLTHQWRTRARNGQVDLTLHVDLLALGLVDLKLQAAGADAWLKTITGAEPSTTAIPHSRADLGVATDPVALNLSLLGVASASASTAAVAQDPVTCVGPFPHTESVGTQWGAALAELVRSLRIRLLGLSVPVPGANLIAGLLAPVGDLVLTPLLQTLGIQLGGADVTVVYLNAGEPRLVQ